MKKLSVHIHKAVNSELFFHLVAGNNKIVATSETYKNRKDLLKTVALILQAEQETTVIKDLTKENNT